MEKTLGYIFGSLHTTEKSIYEISRVLNRQMKTNRKLSMMMVIGGAYIMMLVAQQKEQAQKIKELESQIADLEPVVEIKEG